MKSRRVMGRCMPRSRSRRGLMGGIVAATAACGAARPRRRQVGPTGHPHGEPKQGSGALDRRKMPRFVRNTHVVEPLFGLDTMTAADNSAASHVLAGSLSIPPGRVEAHMRSRLVWMFAIGLAGRAAVRWAQQTTGNLRGTVTDDTGAYCLVSPSDCAAAGARRRRRSRTNRGVFRFRTCRPAPTTSRWNSPASPRARRRHSVALGGTPTSPCR
jgi:hypothetical protein